MSNRHVTVTLYPLFNDTHPLRTLTLTKHDMPVAIGRASKRETRKRNPATENAWFESRVMSRDHAVLKMSPGQNMIFISDCGSTHGTYLNNTKLVANVDHPLFCGDTIRFGVDVDRGQEIFEAIEVRCGVQWPKPQYVVIDDEDAVKLDPSPSRNSFFVPEDSDSEPAESWSNGSEASVFHSGENTILLPEDISPVSIDLGSKDNTTEDKDRDPKSKDESTKVQQEIMKETLTLHSGLLPSVESPSKIDVQTMVATMGPDLPTPMSDEHPNSDAKPSIAKAASNGKPLCIKPVSATLPPFVGDSLPAVCYQRIPEIQYNNWTMMRPMFMRLADMAWGESNSIPDIDHHKRVIHAARRCSLSVESYWIDDCSSFKPRVGTEIYWEPDFEESDTSFHRMPGSLLRYWSVDKRRYWIICEDESDQQAGDRWWIVEKPMELLSENLKHQLETETEVDDCHKYWIVRVWEPQMIGGQWCNVAPYWDPGFDESLLYEDDSVDSDEESLGSEDISESESLGNSTSEVYDGYHANCLYTAFDSDSVHGAEWGISDDCPHGDEDDNDEDDAAEEYDEDSDGSENDPEYSSGDEDSEHCDPMSRHVHFSLGADYGKELGCVIHTDAVEVSKHVPEDASSGRRSKDDLAAQLLDSPRSETQPTITHIVPGMTKPGARFPTYNVSDQLPESCQDKFPIMQRRIEHTVGVPSFSHGYKCAYHDGPFSTSFSADVPELHVPPGDKSPLKRTATEMESSFVESDPSQDAQRLPVEPVSQPDLYTISPEARDAISSALAENFAATAENERPAKRVKPNHSTSKTLASHATTAVVSALLGGLGTIAMLAALPNEYFQ